jgi:hypothetical protein
LNRSVLKKFPAIVKISSLSNFPHTAELARAVPQKRAARGKHHAADASWLFYNGAGKNIRGLYHEKMPPNSRYAILRHNFVCTISTNSFGNIPPEPKRT